MATKARCTECNRLYPALGDTICWRCQKQIDQVILNATRKAEFIAQHGLAEWNAKVEREIKELY